MSMSMQWQMDSCCRAVCYVIVLLHLVRPLLRSFCGNCLPCRALSDLPLLADHSAGMPAAPSSLAQLVGWSAQVHWSSKQQAPSKSWRMWSLFLTKAACRSQFPGEVTKIELETHRSSRKMENKSGTSCCDVSLHGRSTEHASGCYFVTYHHAGPPLQAPAQPRSPVCSPRSWESRRVLELTRKMRNTTSPSDYTTTRAYLERNMETNVIYFCGYL